MKLRKFFLALVFVAVILAIFSLSKKSGQVVSSSATYWEMQSIDSVKYSRDIAREFANDQKFDEEIDLQVKSVAEVGATHIALGTPYDKEFVPFLKRWVDAARKYKLKIWFRGNFSGWENWFDYEDITRDEHQKLLRQFILDNGNLFEDGDIFTSCTECENGGPGDPRHTGDTAGHRQFLINEYQTGRSAFTQIGKNVATNYFPMNADVANLIMDKNTTLSLGGLVVIDHYVSSYEKMNDDINRLAERSGGKVVIGEFGAPIPDLHGDMTEDEQVEWIRNAFGLLSKNKNVVGVNYWTGFGGSTRIWENDGQPRKAVGTVKSYYSPKAYRGIVKDGIGNPIQGAIVISNERSVTTGKSGEFAIPFEGDEVKVNINKEGFHPIGVTGKENSKDSIIVLRIKQESLIFKIQKFFYSVFN